MRLPSLDDLAQITVETIKRFPFVVVSAALSLFMLWTAIDEADWFDPGHIFGAIIGIGMFFAIALFAERSSKPKLHWIISLLGIVLLVGYGLYVGDKPEDNLIEIYRFALFLLAVHALVSFAGFLRSGTLTGFWEFNKILFLRFLLALLFSGVCLGGLAIGMLAVDQLLLDGDVIKPEAYGKLFLVVGMLFNTLFFLAGVPRNIDALEKEQVYPKGLKIFSANLLLPLVVLYLAILYTYGLKILIEWEWPKGWTGWLVLSFSVLGILALLLLWPLSKREENRWIPRFTRWFYLAVLPLIGLLFAAIFRRISEYGVTENRYFVVLLAAWLTGISLYFLLSKGKNIKFIPISLCGIALFSSFGPWSAFAVSTRSQVARFEGLVIKNEMLVEGKIDRVKGAEATIEDQEEMRDILGYLDERDELDELTTYIEEDIQGEDVDSYSFASHIGIGYGRSPLLPNGSNRSFLFDAGEDLDRIVGVRDFDIVLLNLNYYGEKSAAQSLRPEKGNGNHVREFMFEEEQCSVFVRRQGPEVMVLRGSDTILRFPLKYLILEQTKDSVEGVMHYIRGLSRMVEATNGLYHGRLIINNGQGDVMTDAKNEVIWLSSLHFHLLLGKHR